MKKLNLASLFMAALFGLQCAAYADEATALQPGVTPPAAKAWKNSGEFSAVSANGNSRSTTTSAKNTFDYNWTKTLLELTAGALGSSSGDQVTSEQYNAGEKVSYTLAKKDYVFERFGWDANRFAGYRNRYDFAAGLGRVLLELPKDTLSTEIGPGYINEERIDAPRNEFVSGRAYAKYVHTLSKTASFSQDCEYLHHFSDSNDYRLNTETAIIASLTEHLSLKASYVWHRVGLPPPNTGKDDTLTSVALIVNY